MASDGEDGGSPLDRDYTDPNLDDDLDDGDMAETSFIGKDGKVESNGSYEHASNGKSKSSKDPQRPRRKKARRACHACQRAHLTCGKYFLCLKIFTYSLRR
jgi:hypothetical protein